MPPRWTQGVSSRSRGRAPGTDIAAPAPIGPAGRVHPARSAAGASTRDLRASLEELHPEAWAWSRTCCAGNAAEAEDVLQSVYLGVLEGRLRFEERSSFKTWIFGVVRRSALERRRTRHQHAGLLRRWFTARATEDPSASPDGSPSGGGPEADLEAAELGARVQLALARLSARQREVVELVFYHELTLREASVVMELSLGSAKTHYDRGKRELRRLLAAEDEQ